MHSSAPASQSSGSLSSSTASTVDIISSFLTMPENFQSIPVLGPSNPSQVSLPGGSSAASLTGSVYNVSGVSAPATSSEWQLPPAPSTSFQPLISSGCLYQHCGTNMLSEGAGPSQISTPAASNPGVFEWASTGGSKQKSSSLRDFTVTVVDKDTALSSVSMASQGDTTSDSNSMGSLYTSFSARFVQAAPSHIPNQRHSLSLPYQGLGQTYYYNQGTLGPLLSAELGPYLQSYGSVVSYTESRTSVPQPELVTELKESQPTNVIPPASTSGIYCSVPAQSITQTSFQVMESSLGLEPPDQTAYLQKFPKSCSSRRSQLVKSNPPAELGDISGVGTVQSSSSPLALPPAPSQGQTENKNLDTAKDNRSEPLGTYQIPIEKQDFPWLPLEAPEIHQLQACIDPLGPEEQPACEYNVVREKGLILKKQETFDNGTESNDSSMGVTTLMLNSRLPQFLSSLDDLDQSKGPTVIKSKGARAIKSNGEWNKSRATEAPSEQARKNTHTASEPISGAPEAKIKPYSPDCICLRELGVCNTATSDKAPKNSAEHPDSKLRKAAPCNNSKTESHEQKKRKRDNSKEAEESKQSRNKAKAEEKPTIPKMKRKRNHPETFKKPRGCLDRHMLGSAQVFHALGGKPGKKTELSSSRSLGNSSISKGPRPVSTLKRRLEAPSEGKVPDKTRNKREKTNGNAEKGSSSASQYELPPPGKVKLIPLPFLNSDKPQVRPLPRRTRSLASRRPAVANPAQPGSNTAQRVAVTSSRPTPASVTGPATPAQPFSRNPSPLGLASPAAPGSNSAQTNADSPSQPTPTSGTGPARPAWPVLNNPSRPALTNLPGPTVPQSLPSRPVPYKTSDCTSFQHKTIPTAVTETQSPHKPRNQYLLQDFALQSIPWKKPNISGPVMSKPITNDQRPWREAMKRKAQLERENAAKYTSLKRVRDFKERGRKMDTSLCYGCAM